YHGSTTFRFPSTTTQPTIITDVLPGPEFQPFSFRRVTYRRTTPLCCAWRLCGMGNRADWRTRGYRERILTRGRRASCAGQVGGWKTRFGWSSLKPRSQPRGCLPVIGPLFRVAILGTPGATPLPRVRPRGPPRRSTCLSNLRQLGTATMMYLQDY